MTPANFDALAALLVVPSNVQPILSFCFCVLLVLAAFWLLIPARV